MGLYRIEPVGKVGSVRTPAVQLEVRPKERIGLRRLLFLLGYAGDQGFRDDSVAAVEETDLWSALAESLAHLADRALSRGVLQGYLNVDESLRTVKGRIRISDQISRRPGMLVPLEVSYDEFTEDIAENRILRAALERMSQVPGVPPGRAQPAAAAEGKARRRDAPAVRRAAPAVAGQPDEHPLPRGPPAGRGDPAQRLGGGRRRQAAVGVVRGGHVPGLRGLRRDGAAGGHGGVPGGDAAALQRAAQRGRARLRPDRRAARRGPFPGRTAGDGVRGQVPGGGRRRGVALGGPLPDAGLLHVAAGADGVAGLSGRRAKSSCGGSSTRTSTWWNFRWICRCRRRKSWQQ